ncbi:MAG TPA: MFS transporter [Bryobacteraceae bacterium]|nr:MFS transporter [Bryobacteraceae bacterium]
MGSSEAAARQTVAPIVRPAAEAPASWRSTAGVALGVLFGVNLLNFYDRQILGPLLEPIRREFHLTDTQLGALSTIFLVLYAIVGVPFGRLADSWSRKKLLALGMIVWSALTASSGFAASYIMLLFTRLGVGVGEAVCAPVGTSWIGDLFPVTKRSRALAFFMLAVPLGTGLSYMVSGPVAQAFGWRAAFWLAAAPVILLAPALFALREPRRGAAEHRLSAGEHLGAWSVLRIPTLWWIIASGALINFNLYALGTFLPAFLIRVHGLSVARAGLWLGVGSVIAGLFAASAGGIMGDWAIRRSRNGRMLVASIGALAAAPLALWSVLLPAGSWIAVTVLMCASYGLLNTYYGMVYSSIHDIVAPALRGTAMSVYFMAMYLCGASFGPVITGRLSDVMARRAAGLAGSSIVTEAARATGLQQAMLVIPALSLLLALVLYAGSRTIARDMAARDQQLQLQGTPS